MSHPWSTVVVVGRLETEGRDRSDDGQVYEPEMCEMHYATQVWRPMVALICGGRSIENAEDLVARYCGQPWAGGRAETWAWQYFDAVAVDDPFGVGPVDVLAAGSLHAGLTRADLVFFADNAESLSGWLRDMPVNVGLVEADDCVVERIVNIPGTFEAGSLALLSKVLHRKRPGLVPMFDRALADQYRVPGGPRGEAAWPSLISTIRADLELNSVALRDVADRLEAAGMNPMPTALRVVDIAIWMAANTPKAHR